MLYEIFCISLHTYIRLYVYKSINEYDNTYIHKKYKSNGMEKKIHVEFVYVPKDKEGKWGDTSMFFKLKKEMSFRPCVGDMIFLKDQGDDPFIVDSIVLDFPEDNDEHREGITAWLSLPKLK